MAGALCAPRDPVAFVDLIPAASIRRPGRNLNLRINVIIWSPRRKALILFPVTDDVPTLGA